MDENFDESQDELNGNERLLMVDDEESITNYVQRALHRLGYIVTAARSPMEALALLTAHHGAFDLLLADVVMPEMNGHQLAQKVNAMHPQIKTLFMSGYPEEIIATDGFIQEGLNFIDKPFTAKRLSAKIREVLDGSPKKITGATRETW